MSHLPSAEVSDLEVRPREATPDLVRRWVLTRALMVDGSWGAVGEENKVRRVEVGANLQALPLPLPFMCPSAVGVCAVKTGHPSCVLHFHFPSWIQINKYLDACQVPSSMLDLGTEGRLQGIHSWWARAEH